jgi:hypothetical protein
MMRAECGSMAPAGNNDAVSMRLHASTSPVPVPEHRLMVLDEYTHQVHAKCHGFLFITSN